MLDEFIVINGEAIKFSLTQCHLKIFRASEKKKTQKLSKNKIIEKHFFGRNYKFIIRRLDFSFLHDLSEIFPTKNLDCCLSNVFSDKCYNYNYFSHCCQFQLSILNAPMEFQMGLRLANIIWAILLSLTDINLLQIIIYYI